MKYPRGTYVARTRCCGSLVGIVFESERQNVLELGGVRRAVFRRAEMQL